MEEHHDGEELLGLGGGGGDRGVHVEVEAVLFPFGFPLLAQATGGRVRHESGATGGGSGPVEFVRRFGIRPRLGRKQAEGANGGSGVRKRSEM